MKTCLVRINQEGVEKKNYETIFIFFKNWIAKIGKILKTSTPVACSKFKLLKFKTILMASN
jgi:hypothetical protein